MLKVMIREMFKPRYKNVELQDLVAKLSPHWTNVRGDLLEELDRLIPSAPTDFKGGDAQVRAVQYAIASGFAKQYMHYKSWVDYDKHVKADICRPAPEVITALEKHYANLSLVSMEEAHFQISSDIVAERYNLDASKDLHIDVLVDCSILLYVFTCGVQSTIAHVFGDNAAVARLNEKAHHALSQE